MPAGDLGAHLLAALAIARRRAAASRTSRLDLREGRARPCPRGRGAARRNQRHGRNRLMAQGTIRKRGERYYLRTRVREIDPDTGQVRWRQIERKAGSSYRGAERQL